MSEHRAYRTWFWALLLGGTLFRLLIAGQFGLGTDEAHYVLYAANLAWGYVEHPPMVAFLGAATTTLGDGLFFVRLGPILCWVASTILLRALALALYEDERVAFWASAVMFAMPLLQLMAVALLPDATLNLFWVAGLLAVWHAVRKDSWWLWITTGVCFGGALLSKYHGVLFPLCVFGFLVASKERRRVLLGPKPYVALALGLLIFVPNIVWNAEHDWISYAFQGGRASKAIDLGSFGQAVGGQFGALSPILFGLLIAAWVVLLRERPRTERDRFVIWTSLPIFVFFCLMGLRGKILPHWTAIGCWTGSIALAAVAIRRVGAGGTVARRWRRWSRAGGALGLLMVALLFVAVCVPVVAPVYGLAHDASVWLSERVSFVKPLPAYQAHFDLSNHLYGWDDAAEAVEQVRAGMPDPDRTFVFCHRFFTASQLGVHLPPGTEVTSLSGRKSQYLVWFSPVGHTGWDALYVDDGRSFKGPERYADLFERVDPEPVEVEALRDGELAHAFRVYRCYGFVGRLP